METTRTEMANVIRMLNLRPIAYLPIYKILTGSTNAGILLSQIMYWYAAVNRKFWKTDKELCAELLFTPDELKNAKNKLKSIPFLKITREGMPAKTWIEVNYDLYISTLKVAVQQIGDIADKFGYIAEHVGGNQPILFGQNPPTAIIYNNNTEITTENTIKKDTNVSKESGRNSPEVPKQGKFVAPTLEEFKAYYDKELSEKYEFDIENVYQGYAVADWHDSQGKPIKNWKQKLRQVWCNERNLRKEEEKKIDPQMQKMIDIANAHAARGGTF